MIAQTKRKREKENLCPLIVYRCVKRFTLDISVKIFVGMQVFTYKKSVKSFCYNTALVTKTDQF